MKSDDREAKIKKLEKQRNKAIRKVIYLFPQLQNI